MRLTKRTNGIWMLECRDNTGNRRRLSTGTRSKTEAEAKVPALLRSLQEGGRVGDYTLSTALWDTFDETWQHKSHPDQYRSRIGRLCRHFGHTPLASIDTKWLKDAMKDMQREYRITDTTVNRYLNLISKVLTVGVEEGHIKARPKVPYRAEDNKKQRYLSMDEQRALIDKCHELWPTTEAEGLACLIQVLVDTGGRLSEVLAVPRIGRKRLTFMHDAFDPERRTKSKRSRTVPLTAAAEAALPRIPKWTVSQCISRFTRVSKACGLHQTGVTLHTLRHTCASRLVQGGMDLYQVKEWLGHSSINVTQRYAHLNPRQLDAGADILNTMNGG